MFLKIQYIINEQQTKDRFALFIDNFSVNP